MEDTTLQIVEHPTVTPDTPPGETSDSEPMKADSDPIKADQINGVLVLSLLDKIIGAVDQIQATQSQLETRQQEMESVVTSIQGELTKLTKSHATTSNTASKLLDKVRKVSVNVKTVRHNLERQQAQIKKLESNESELLKRRNFKVMIYQDEVKLPSKLSISKSLKDAEKTEVEEEGQVKEKNEEEEDADHIQLSSDEEVEVEEIIEESRAERIKRSGMKRVDDIKKAFSKEKMEKTRVKTRENLEKTKVKTRENLEKTKQNIEKTRQNIEKRMNKLGTKIVTNERREKMKTSKDKFKKSFTPDHPVYARSKTAVYKVPPFTFYVKKIREGEVEVQATEMVEVGGDDAEEEEVEVEEGTELLRGESPDPHSFLKITEDADAVLAERSDSD